MTSVELIGTEPLDVGQTPQVIGTEEAGNHFLKRWQLWNEREWKWLPYDRSTYVDPAPEADDLDNFFYVNLRYQRPDAAPELVLTNFSKTLIYFFRSWIGNHFFNDEPEQPIKEFFHRLKDLKAKRSSALLPPAATDEEVRTLANTLGYNETSGPKDQVEHARQYLVDLYEHLEILISFVEEEFQPTADRYALQLSYGQIAYDFLIYYYEPGEKYYIQEGGDHIAFVLNSVQYEGETFAIYGGRKYWDGSDYIMTSERRIAIDRYSGTEELTSLTCQPMTAEMQARLTERGRLYNALSGIHYRSYHGNRIIVDRKSWNDRGNSASNRLAEGPLPELDESDLYLLPATVFGFDLVRKSWEEFRVEDIGPVVFDDKAWDHLVLDPDTKVLLKALVKVTRNANTSSTIITDVISNKGGGLIAVLHGPPGTGKTLTAEAIAEHLRRPLYMVGSSELSTTPSQMEQHLKEILNLATTWDAVLLIDEADVFLEKRSLHEIDRNALVSVALRVLEYHRGVLFLTTNRIQTFDEAFLSRFSIAIKYPELDHDARLAIWRKFFELTETTQAVTSGRSTPTDVVTVGKDGSIKELCPIPIDELHELAEKPFNGRTIKNLVRTAQALALSSNEKLSIDHVKMVVQVQEKFLTEFSEV